MWMMAVAWMGWIWDGMGNLPVSEMAIRPQGQVDFATAADDEAKDTDDRCSLFRSLSVFARFLWSLSLSVFALVFSFLLSLCSYARS